MTVTTDRTPRLADRHKVLDVADAHPGLRWYSITRARATFDYRDIPGAEAARAAVGRARAVLGTEFGVTFTEDHHVNGADGPRYMLEAKLPSGLTLVIVSRVSLDPPAPVTREPELATVAA